MIGNQWRGGGDELTVGIRCEVGDGEVESKKVEEEVLMKEMALMRGSSCGLGRLASVLCRVCGRQEFPNCLECPVSVTAERAKASVHIPQPKLAYHLVLHFVCSSEVILCLLELFLGLGIISASG